MNLEYEAERRDGMTFVTVTVHNPAPVKRHARLENRLDSPVLPPRRNGVPECGWDETGVTLTVAAGRTVGVGYVCSSPPTEPAVEIEATARGAAPVEDAEFRARRSLGTFRPPRMAVTGSAETNADETDQLRRDSPAQRTVEETEPDPTETHGGVRESQCELPEHGDDVNRAVRRVELGERLAAAGVEEAADVLEDLAETDLVGDEPARVGPAGIELARGLDSALDDDAETFQEEASRLRSKADRLRRAAERAAEDAARAQSRADRARSVELPIDTLERFA